MKFIDQHLTRSILLEESATPLIMRYTIWFLVFLMIAFIVWIIFAKVDELAFASGEIIPTGHTIKIQHPDGGKIIELAVKNGDMVNEGQLLLSLDAGIALINKEETEKKLTLMQEKESILEQQLAIVQNLTEKQLQSKISFLNTKAELTDIKLRILELQETLKKSMRTIDMATIKAPFAGQVHNFEFRNKGEVISPGKVIMEIIPRDQKPVAEVKINPKDIGLIKVGMNATVKVVTYDFTRFGTLDGHVTELSVSSYLDENRSPYYKGLIAINKNYLGDPKGPHVVLPGMSINAEIATGQKTIFQYLLKPIYISLQKSFYER